MAKSVNIYEVIESCAQNCDIYSFQFGHLIPKDENGNRVYGAREIIDNHEWGTRGKDGKETLTRVLLANCETEHLKNILRTQPQISSLTTLVIMAILMERGEIQKTSSAVKNSSKSVVAQ